MKLEGQLGEMALLQLHDDVCPFCGNDLEYGHRFQQEDGRFGGLMTCEVCRIRIAWIDAPFEVRIESELDAP